MLKKEKIIFFKKIEEKIHTLNEVFICSAKKIRQEQYTYLKKLAKNNIFYVSNTFLKRYFKKKSIGFSDDSDSSYILLFDCDIISLCNTYCQYICPSEKDYCTGDLEVPAQILKYEAKDSFFGKLKKLNFETKIKMGKIEILEKRIFSCNPDKKYSKELVSLCDNLELKPFLRKINVISVYYPKKNKIVSASILNMLEIEIVDRINSFFQDQQKILINSKMDIPSSIARIAHDFHFLKDILK